MRSDNNWSEWGLVVAAVLLLAAFHRAELIPVITPVALFIGYVVTLVSQSGPSSSVKYGARK